MKKKISIEGMRCSSCASNVAKSFKRLSAVKHVTVVLVSKKVFIECSQEIENEDIKKTINRAGFKLVSIEND